MNSKSFDKISISPDVSILAALKIMDKENRKLLLVVDGDGKYINLLSIGDIQRAIIADVPLNTAISNIFRKLPVKVASIHDDIENIKSDMRDMRIEFMPIIDDAKNIIDIIYWGNLENEKSVTHFELPVVIMAGGKGERLKPLTNVLPKPLIPIGKQTILEDIMDNFAYYGCSNFYLSINYKADFIKRYIEEIGNDKYHITFFQENKPLGTAGSLNLLSDKIDSTFFVSNCDIIVNAEYDNILKYHRENNNEITIVAALKNYPIPYGTLETGLSGILKTIHEKPELTFKINTGMYIMEPHLLSEIPHNKFYHITMLIEKLINENRKVGVFPISEGSWIDIGNWNEYMKFVTK